MLAVAGARENLQSRKVLAHDLRRAHRGIHIVDREHEEIGGLRACGAQQVEPRGIAVVDAVAEATHEVDVRLTRIERGEFDVPRTQHARDDLPDAAEAGDDDAIVALVDLVERRGGLSVEERLAHAIMHREEQRSRSSSTR